MGRNIIPVSLAVASHGNAIRFRLPGKLSFRHNLNPVSYTHLVNGWTVEDNLAYRQSYAPDILQEIGEWTFWDCNKAVSYTHLV